MIILGARVLGMAQGLIFPATLAYVADQSGTAMGTGMGLYGAMRNLGKVVGPVAGGVILAFGSFDDVLVAAASLLLALAVMLEVRPGAVLAAMAVVMAVVMPVVEASTTRASMITYRNLMTTCRTMT